MGAQSTSDWEYYESAANTPPLIEWTREDEERSRRREAEISRVNFERKCDDISELIGGSDRVDTFKLHHGYSDTIRELWNSLGKIAASYVKRKAVIQQWVDSPCKVMRVPAYIGLGVSTLSLGIDAVYSILAESHIFSEKNVEMLCSTDVYSAMLLAGCLFGVPIEKGLQGLNFMFYHKQGLELVKKLAPQLLYK